MNKLIQCGTCYKWFQPEKITILEQLGGYVGGPHASWLHKLDRDFICTVCLDQKIEENKIKLG